MTIGRWILALASCSVMPAQQTTATTAAGAPDGSAGPGSPHCPHLSVTDRLCHDTHHFIDVDNIVYAGMGAALDQWRARPGEWGEGWGAFAQRYGSHLGQYTIQRSIMFSVQAINGEDARYFRSNRRSLGGRLGDAFFHTIWRRDDTGGMMLAYSEFLADYGAAALSRYWWPARFHTGRAIFTAGSDTILIDAGINVLHEVAPDVKRWLHLT